MYGNIRGIIKGDTRSLGYSSYLSPHLFVLVSVCPFVCSMCSSHLRLAAKPHAAYVTHVLQTEQVTSCSSPYIAPNSKVASISKARGPPCLFHSFIPQRTSKSTLRPEHVFANPRFHEMFHSNVRRLLTTSQLVVYAKKSLHAEAVMLHLPKLFKSLR